MEVANRSKTMHDIQVPTKFSQLKAIKLSIIIYDNDPQKVKATKWTTK